MKITLDVARRLLNNCAAVIWEDNFLSYPSVVDNGTAGEDDSEFLKLTCEDDEGQIFEAHFNEGNNREVIVEGSSMFLIDDNKETVQITLLVPQNPLIQSV